MFSPKNIETDNFLVGACLSTAPLKYKHLASGRRLKEAKLKIKQLGAAVCSSLRHAAEL